MNTKYLYKDTFAVIGKVGQGSVNNSQEWILPLWNEASTHFSEIADIIRKNENGMPFIWGAMNDVNEQNGRWSDTGKYMASSEADVDAIAPEGWTKWVIPAQTYLVVSCTMDEYGDVFDSITSDPEIKIVGTVHEYYPEPDNPNIVELYFPIAAGTVFCQSCYMPMTKPEDFGTEKDGAPSPDYCCHCYTNGDFNWKPTFKVFVEDNIRFWRDGCINDDEARARIMEIFPKLKRWNNQ